MSQPFRGQYLASFSIDGQNGHLTINVDRDRGGEGVAYFVVYAEPMNFYVFNCRLEQETGSISGTVQRATSLEGIHNKPTDDAGTGSQVFEIKILTNQLPHKLIYTNEEGTKELPLHPIASNVMAETKLLLTWKEFKDWVETIRSKDTNAIFRGVSKACYGLKTSFHRTGRVDLERYRDTDIQVFRDFAETIGGLKLSTNPDDNGALWGFAQHHGFPTPLLDWTESPYIAAYFAFSERLQNIEEYEGERVKIYYLNGKFVESQRPINLQIADVFPRIWVFRPSSKGNQRLVFQQGQFLHSNIVEIESYLMSLPHKGELPLISSVEMPASLAPEAIDELAFMGVSHLSLFPGLDGAAKHATFKQFYRPT